MSYLEWINEAEKLCKQGKSFSEIGRILKVNRKLVSYYLKQRGLQSRYANMYRPGVIQKTKKYFNEDAFEKIDTEEKAYWLGFLYADGNVSEKRNAIELSLKEADYEHICKFKSFLKSEHIIGKKVKRMNETQKEYVSYRLGVRSNKTKSDLIKWGCIPNKTKKLTFPKNLPPHLIKHFIRGYLDADGCITNSQTSKTSIEILGCEQFLIDMAKYFNVEGHIYGFNHSDIKRFIIAGKKAREILEHLYGDATIYLNRKYERYLQHCRLS